MKKKLIGIIILLLFMTASTIKREAIASFSNLPEVVIMNTEALQEHQIGRICYDGCHITEDTEDFCTQCMQHDCLDYFLREPIGLTDNCPE